jgi:16S rRNA processing protein RimM
VSDPDDLLVVGRIARAHGLRGEVIVNLETDFPESRFRRGNVMFVDAADGARALTIEDVRFQQGRPVVAFEGIDSIEAAEELGRGDLRMPRSSLEPLPENTFYHHELVGCSVVTEGGESIGEVTRVDGPASTSRLVVQGRGREVLVPLVTDICRSVDLAARRIVIAPPEGLLDLNG